MKALRIVASISLGLAFGVVVGVPLAGLFGFMRVVSRGRQ